VSYRDVPPEKLIERIHELEREVLRLQLRPKPWWARFVDWLRARRAPKLPPWGPWVIDSAEHLGSDHVGSLYEARLHRMRGGDRSDSVCISDTGVIWRCAVTGEHAPHGLSRQIERYVRAADARVLHEHVLRRAEAMRKKSAAPS
jgi:hypothetical protein